MTPPEDAPPIKPSPSLTSHSSSVLPKIRRSSNSEVTRDQPSTLPYRSNEKPLPQSSTSTLFSPTSTSVSPGVTSPNSSRPRSYERSASRSGISSPSLASEGRHDEPRSIILRAFVPHVAVYASKDTEDLIRGKGFDGGLLQLLKCFGERIQGKVVIRDSVGASRGWEDFSIRFTSLGDDVTRSRSSGTSHAAQTDRQVDGALQDTDHTPSLPTPGRSDRPMMELDEVVDHHLSDASVQAGKRDTDYLNFRDAPQEPPTGTSPFFAIYLRKLLSGMPMVAHETFSHPVACVIAISSHNTAPIEALRQLYGNTSQGNRRVPGWVSNEYLRYYVLVHDEDIDDVTKTTSLFEQMKRHFGLHCHLLRLRSSQCIPTDDESTPVPTCEWLSASKELSDIRKKGNFAHVKGATGMLTFCRRCRRR